MSLKTDYFDGPSGLQQTLNNTFQAGVDFVGSGAAQVVSVDFNNRDGAALQSGGGTGVGFYFDVNSYQNVTYRVWYKTSAETAPTNPGNLVEVDILTSDSNLVVATKTKTALNLLNGGATFSATTDLDLLTINNINAGAANAPSLGTLNTGGGNAAVSTETTGVAPTGNFLYLQSQLRANALQGLTTFTVTINTSYNPAYLRGSTACPPDPNRQKNNWYLKAYLAGIQQAMADQQIYSYEVDVALDIDDTINTAIDFNFHFTTT